MATCSFPPVLGRHVEDFADVDTEIAIVAGPAIATCKGCDGKSHPFGGMAPSGWTNDASVILAFESPNFDTTPPTTSSMESCGASISVKNISFDGGFVAAILNLFKGLIRRHAGSCL